jgi:hypothetical protein
MAMAKIDGRGGKSSRGIGGAGKTSTKNPGSISGYANKVSAKNQGGTVGRADPGKDRNAKNYGSSGRPDAGPKYGRDKGAKRY